MMRRKTIAVLLALCMALCVGIPAAGAITAEDMENAPVLIPGEVATVNITTGGQYAYFKVVPEFSCQYTFYSTGSRDTIVYLYDAEGTQTASDDDSGDEYNFRLVVTLTEGETYYLGARIWGTGNTGSYPLYSEVHSVDAWTTVTPATCTEPGEETGTCTICGEEITREIEPLGHDWEIATSNNNGTHTHTCARCGITQTDPCTYEDHSDGGFTTHTCTQCGYSYTNELTGEGRVALWDFEEEPTDWTFVDADGDGYNWEWYSTSSAYEGDYVLRSDSWYNGSALTPDNWAISPAFSLIGTDSAWVNLWVKDSSYDDIIALYAGISTDVDSMTKISEDISPTSSYEQLAFDLSDFAGEPFVYLAIRHYNCTDQYYVYVDYVEVSATYAECTDHVLVEVPAAEATCTEGGHCAYWECENCGRMFYDEDGTEPAMPGDVFNSPALGHNWGEAVSNNNGTHTYTCDRCHETRTEDCTFEMHMEDGVVVDVCTECGYTVHSDLIAYWDFEKEPVDWWFYDADGDGYNWDWVYDEGWTCYGGVGIIHSASYINNIGALSPDNIAVSPAFSLAECTDATLSAWARGQDSSANGEVFAFYAGTTYNPDDWVKVSEDYTTDGEYREYTADLSEFVGEPVVHIAIRHYNVTDMYWLNIDDVSIKGTPVDPCETGNHSMTYVPAKEPTETEDGNIAYYVCDVCGYYYLDEEGMQPVSAADVILPGGYPVTVDENIEHGTVVTFVTRAKPGDFVPLNVTPDQGAVLEYLAYVDEDGQETVIAAPEGALDSAPMQIAKQPEGKLTPNAKIGTPAGLTKSGAPVSVVKAETEIEENYFIMPGSAVTVIAEFGPKYTVTLDPGDAGGDLLYITSLDEGVWAEDLSSSMNGQFSPYSVGLDAFTLPDNPFTWNNHTFANWLLVLGEDSAEANPGVGYYANDYTLIAQWTEDELEDGYYLIGPDWTFTAINADEKFEVNPGNENEYMLSTTLAEGDEIKVVHLTNNVIDAWYPDGEYTQYHVDAAHAGSVNIYFQTTYNNAWSAFGGYFYIGEGAEPEFKTHSLTLDGKIGVNFFMDLPAIAGVDYTESYMTFEISGAGEVPSDPVPLDEDNMNGDSTYYGFTCYVAPIQMADTITATFHYGDGLTVSEEYSIAQYIETFEDLENQYDEPTVSLVHALADYGHYVQLFLEGVKDWSLGDGDDQYAPMDIFYEKDGYNAEDIAEDVAEFALVRNNESTDIQKITYSVRLDSDTTILVYFKPVKNYSGEFTVTLDGDPYTATPEGGRYVVEIPNIGAHLLGTTYTIVATTDSGDATVEVSVFSYVRSILNSSAYADNTAAKNGVCAIYAYYVAAKAYKDAQPEN
ncbi:MAG: hypothetical protein IKP38_04105 [Clostridia bacterium]|nr:hypothetical protein [Clostridia bacterium]